MSSLIVQVAEITNIVPHPNADKLEILHVLGWQLVAQKEIHVVGNKVVYFPPDTVIPQKWSDEFGVTKYLSKGRIKAAKLRGEYSFGLAIPVPDPTWEIGQNVAEYYEATKYEPPIRTGIGEAERDHALFQKYTDIENMRNFPAIFEDGELVVVGEKIHGTNSRVGVIEGVTMAGSKTLRRKPPADGSESMSIYWSPLKLDGVKALMLDLEAQYKQVILYGEVYGGSIQSFDYGIQKGRGLGFRAFDLLIDGKYVSYPRFLSLCEKYGIPVVPILGTFPFSLQLMKELSSGSTLVDGGSHIREGVVVRPIDERSDPRLGRVILKYVSDEYLGKDKTDYTEE